MIESSLRAAVRASAVIEKENPCFLTDEKQTDKAMRPPKTQTAPEVLRLGRNMWKRQEGLGGHALRTHVAAYQYRSAPSSFVVAFLQKY